MALLVFKWDKEVKLHHVPTRRRTRIDANISSGCYSQIKLLREGRWVGSGEKGVFGTTNLQFEFHLTPYKSRGADPSNAPEGVPGSVSCLQVKGQCSGEQPGPWSQPTPSMSGTDLFCDPGPVT